MPVILRTVGAYLRSLIMSISEPVKSLSRKRPSSPSNNLANEVSESVSNSLPLIRRKMHAILIMYSGWGFYGMQRSPVYPTIEGELSKALLICGQLDNVTGEDHRKVRFQRASKTDKSVSATGQCCSMMIRGDDNLLNKLNETLPETIRVLDIIRVTRNFNAKQSCSYRVYDYFLPTFALAPRNSLNDEHDHWNYRISAEQLAHANNILEKYKGTHNYFNFTSGRLPTDNSCQRYIMSMECLPAFLFGNGEYTIIRIIGQSFMLHQIRKMIGLMLGIVRGHTDESVFEIVFGKQRVDIPKAPGLGLMLNHVSFSQYNEKFKNDGIHEPIDWTKYEEQMNLFKMTHIYNHIDKLEIEEKSMFNWLPTLDIHTYNYRESGSPTFKRNESNNLEINNQVHESNSDNNKCSSDQNQSVVSGSL